MIAEAGDIFSIIVADIVLSGDNALIIGMAAASLPPEMRKKAIFYGMVVAALLRIVFAVIATKLLGIPGLLFVGALLLFWVCWRLFGEIREANRQSDGESSAVEAGETAELESTGSPRITISLSSCQNLYASNNDDGTTPCRSREGSRVSRPPASRLDWRTI